MQHFEGEEGVVIRFTARAVYPEQGGCIWCVKVDETPSAVGLLENSALGWKVQSFEGDHEPMVGLRSYNRLLAQEVDPEGVPFGKSFCMYFSAVVRCQRWRGAPSRVPERDKR